ncbi:hypothetical protein GCM10022226_68010 [Sphaerisporangium flaviroseum]|uniref:Uncharacterized protein n=1 Tax=Sphaerisporangium flaviroseum TaxID=509199 RepID=A0ABP7J6W1_9ACTN
MRREKKTQAMRSATSGPSVEALSIRCQGRAAETAGAALSGGAVEDVMLT